MGLWLNQHLLSLLIGVPLGGAMILALLPPHQRPHLNRHLALIFSGLTLAFNGFLCWRFEASEAAFQFVEQALWIPSFNIHYALAVDGLSLFLTLLTSFLTFLVIFSTSLTLPRLKAYLALLLALEAATMGTFLATDLVLFYLFWEAVLIPMYFLIGMWGGARRIYATVKFFIFTMAGSLLMLVAIICLIHVFKQQAGFFSTDIGSLYQVQLSSSQSLWMFLAFALAFSIKVPLFPVHTWLPDAHVEAPTGGSVLLAGVMLKMGTYALLRFALPLFPQTAVELAPWFAGFSMVGIIYGALVALVQKDIKKLVAYSSISHLGFVVLGIFTFNTSGWQGAIFQMVAHGLSTGGLFFLIGMLYERRHTRDIHAFGGIAKVMPKFAVFLLIISLASMGLPGLNGFVGEFLILIGAFQVQIWWAVLAAVGVILAAAYLLWLYERVAWGEVNGDNKSLHDLQWREVFILVLLVAGILIMGIYPQYFLNRMQPSIEAHLVKIQNKVNAQLSINQWVENTNE